MTAIIKKKIYGNISMKSLNIDVVMSWEYGLAIFLVGLFLVIYGVRQDKKKDDDFTKIPLIKPTTKIMFGVIMMIFGAIQMLPLIKDL